MDPCGTPVVTGRKSDRLELIRTVCYLDERYPWNHKIAWLDKPICPSFCIPDCISSSWLRLSKALLMSKTTEAVSFFYP